MLRELVKKQEAQINQQNIRIENMVQALLHARKKMFGPSSEVTKNIEGQVSLFPEEQKIVEELVKQKKSIMILSHNDIVNITLHFLLLYFAAILLSLMRYNSIFV